ncbi:MAG TPA: hypothetical protein VLK79_01035 [Gaiellales bacterium]|nr:hypothetical protein [Gaiellales bacterium]
MQEDDGQGVGSSFNVWSWPGQLTGQVVAYAQQPDGTVDVQFWGPEFPLTPMFIDPDDILFGRADFFQAFVVSFAPGLPFGAFHLDA